MEPPSLSAEELLQHAGWLRGLARRLVGEAHADDVLQETWKTALERPPRSRAALPAWLAQVTRNAARQIRRSETARHKREASPRSPTSTCPPPRSSSAPTSTASWWTRSCRWMSPIAGCLLLRWFEEREPKEIAALLGMSAGTVRSQLKRGLERLRERLDRRFGDRKTWIGAFVPIAFGRPARIATTGGGALTGGLLMSLKSNTLLPLLAVLVLGGVVAASIAAMSIDARVPRTRPPRSLVAGETPPREDDAPPTRPAVLFGRRRRQRRGPGGLTARVARIDSGDAVAERPHPPLRPQPRRRGRPAPHDDRRRGSLPAGRSFRRATPTCSAWRARASLRSACGPSRSPPAAPTISAPSGWVRPARSTAGCSTRRTVPSAGARVRVFTTVGASWDFMAQIHEVFSALDREPVPEAATTTDRDGRFQFETLPPGIVSVTRIRARSRAAHASAAVVPGAPSADARRCASPTGREVTGTVVDENGAPLVGARVAAVPGQMDFDAVMYGRRFTSSDARGSLRVPRRRPRRGSDADRRLRAVGRP